jgi:phage terminase small subunit
MKQEIISTANLNSTLTDKQEIFCQKYVLLNDATAAYKQVYDCKATPESIRQMAFEVRHTPAVNARIMELQKQALKRNNISVDQVVNRLAQIAFTDLAEIVNYENGLLSIKNFDSLTAAQRACIKEFKIRTVSRMIDGLPVQCDYVEIKLYDQQKALYLLGKYLCMFTDKSKIENVHKFTGPSPIIFGDTSKPIDKETFKQIRQEMLDSDDC